MQSYIDRLAGKLPPQFNITPNLAEKGGELALKPLRFAFSGKGAAVLGGCCLLGGGLWLAASRVPRVATVLSQCQQLVGTHRLRTTIRVLTFSVLGLGVFGIGLSRLGHYLNPADREARELYHHHDFSDIKDYVQIVDWANPQSEYLAFKEIYGPVLAVSMLYSESLNGGGFFVPVKGSEELIKLAEAMGQRDLRVARLIVVGDGKLSQPGYEALLKIISASKGLEQLELRQVSLEGHQLGGDGKLWHCLASCGNLSKLQLGSVAGELSPQDIQAVMELKRLKSLDLADSVIPASDLAERALAADRKGSRPLAVYLGNRSVSYVETLATDYLGFSDAQLKGTYVSPRDEDASAEPDRTGEKPTGWESQHVRFIIENLGDLPAACNLQHHLKTRTFEFSGGEGEENGRYWPITDTAFLPS